MKKYLTLLMLMLVACAGEAFEEDELGQVEQPIWTNVGGHVPLGTCVNRTRDKCSTQSACPGNVACIVPSTKQIKYVLIGTDTPVDPQWDSWKFEFRRVMNALPDNLYGGPSWSAVETTEAQANVVIRRGTCSCVSPDCNTMADLACFQEPTGLGLITLTESLPGTYVRPASATQKRYVFVDIDRLLALAQFEGISGRHFGMEHFSRWVTGTLVGIGSNTGHDGYYLPDAWTFNDASHPAIATDVIIAVHKFNFENEWEVWESCLLKNYSLVNLTSYSLAPVGCGN